MARVATAPTIWDSADSVPRRSWRIVAVSSEETAQERAEATKALDGNPKTMWHSRWSGHPAEFPHQIDLDLGSETTVSGIRLLPRQTGPKNGRPREAKLFLDGKFLQTLTIPDSGDLFVARFDPTKVRRVRVEFTRAWRNEPFLAIAEIGLIRPTRQGSDWQSQYKIDRVETGDARFDLSPAALERVKRAEWARLGKWQPVVLPGPAWVRPLDDPRIWQGVAYYRRKLPIIRPIQRATLLLQGMQSTDFWLNGKYLGGRRGGYLPAQIPIEGGGDLLVRVDNRDNPLIPPGKPQADLDFMYGNGIVAVPRLEITGGYRLATPYDKGGGIEVKVLSASSTQARLRISAPLIGQGWVVVRHPWLRLSLWDGRGRKVWSGNPQGFEVTFGRNEFAIEAAIPRPHLWSPDDPYLYELRCEERQPNQDVRSIKVGIRTITASREKGLLINGKPIRLIGTNRHQDYPWVGPAMSDAAQERDAVLIKRAGHNIVRLSHYNQSPAFLDACDRLGILVIPCIPGWQFTNADPRFKERVLRDIRETVWRDRSHPSVAWWEASLNETYPPAELAKSWNDAAKAAGAELTAGDASRGAPWDILYNGWKEDLSRPSDPIKPGYIREYGDYEFGGGNSSSRVRLREGLPKLLNETWNHVWSLNKFWPQYPSTMGYGTWEMFDHNVPWDFAVSASGLADIMRREKPSFWFFASQTAKRPYLKVAADWQPGAAKRDIVVFTNANSATLLVNGKKIASATPERGAEAPYDLKKAFQGTDTANLPHPPMVFRKVAFAAGELKVVGSNGAVDKVRTAGRPVRLKVWLDDLGVPPTVNDAVFVRAALVDGNDVICSDAVAKVRFAGVTFAGESRVATELGVASVLVRTPSTGGRVKVQATAGSLRGETAFATTK